MLSVLDFQSPFNRDSNGCNLATNTIKRTFPAFFFQSPFNRDSNGCNSGSVHRKRQRGASLPTFSPLLIGVAMVVTIRPNHVTQWRSQLSVPF